MKEIPLKEPEDNVSLSGSRVERAASFVVIKRDASEEAWVEVVDFTKIQKGGVMISKVLNRL